VDGQPADLCRAGAQRVRDLLVEERGRLAAGLAAVPYLEPFPSEANFVLCRVVEGRDAGELRDALALRHGIMVRCGVCWWGFATLVRVQVRNWRQV
jgi:histidinol-phosphate/aromatic aminotransferase/cobyric acid decarboxylase-like protein